MINAFTIPPLWLLLFLHLTKYPDVDIDVRDVPFVRTIFTFGPSFTNKLITLLRLSLFHLFHIEHIVNIIEHICFISGSFPFSLVEFWLWQHVEHNLPNKFNPISHFDISLESSQELTSSFARHCTIFYGRWLNAEIRDAPTKSTHTGVSAALCMFHFRAENFKLVKSSIFYKRLV